MMPRPELLASANAALLCTCFARSLPSAASALALPAPACASFACSSTAGSAASLRRWLPLTPSTFSTLCSCSSQHPHFRVEVFGAFIRPNVCQTAAGVSDGSWAKRPSHTRSSIEFRARDPRKSWAFGL
eukprot:1836965-Rhodomonas_salina.7